MINKNFNIRTHDVSIGVLAAVEMVPSPAQMVANDHLQAAVESVSLSAKRLVREAADAPAPHALAESVQKMLPSLKSDSKILNAIAETKRMCRLVCCFSVQVF